MHSPHQLTNHTTSSHVHEKCQRTIRFEYLQNLSSIMNKVKMTLTERKQGYP